MKTSVDDIDQARLQNRFATLGLTPILDAKPRDRTTLGGEVKRLRIAPRSGNPSLEVMVDDGTGSFYVVFTGRTALGGMHPGRGIAVEGVCHLERGRLVMLNPAYTLLPDSL